MTSFAVEVKSPAENVLVFTTVGSYKRHSRQYIHHTLYFPFHRVTSLHVPPQMIPLCLDDPLLRLGLGL